MATSTDKVLCCGCGVCVMVILFIIGIPNFISGIVLLALDDNDDCDTCSLVDYDYVFSDFGGIFLGIGCAFIVAGIITGVCVWKVASKREQRTPQPGFVMQAGSPGQVPYYNAGFNQNYPAQGSTYPPQGATYPPQGSTYPPQGQVYTTQGQAYPQLEASYQEQPTYVTSLQNPSAPDSEGKMPYPAPDSDQLYSHAL